MRALLERLLLVWLILLSLLAYRFDAWFSAAADPFLATKPHLGLLISVTMLAIGSLLPRDEVRQVIRRWPSVLGGTTVQYASMPLLAYGVGRLFGFEGAVLCGVIMVGCVPGAMASNVLTLAARGNVSYSVSLTTTATLLSPLVVPLALWLALGQWVSLDVLAVSRDLFLTVVLPAVAGHLLSRALPTFRALADRLASIIANLAILWIIAVVVAANRERLGQFDVSVLLALLLVNLAGYMAGYGGGRLLRLSDPMRRALTLEVGMQNAGVGTWLAVQIFKDDPAAAIPPAIYTFGCMFTGTLLARVWAELSARQAVESRP